MSTSTSTSTSTPACPSPTHRLGHGLPLHRGRRPSAPRTSLVVGVLLTVPLWVPVSGLAGLTAAVAAAPAPSPDTGPTGRTDPTAAPRVPWPQAAAPAPRSQGVWPLAPRPDVVRGFAPPAQRWETGHRGVDLAAAPGRVVRTALAGRVAFAGKVAGRGVVAVDHGSVRTTYEPVLPSVAAGDHVSAGAVLGRLTLFGSHCFPLACLHWGLVEGRDRYLDPLSLVGAPPVMLLPLGAPRGGVPVRPVGRSAASAGTAVWVSTRGPSRSPSRSSPPAAWSPPPSRTR